MLEYDGVGYRSGIRPFSGLAVSQKKRKVRSWSSTRNGSMTGLDEGCCNGFWSFTTCASPAAMAMRIMTTDAMVTTNGTPTLECCLDIVTCQSTVAPKQGSRAILDTGQWAPCAPSGKRCLQLVVGVAARGQTS